MTEPKKRTNPFQAETLAKPTQKSGAKARQATDRANAQQPTADPTDGDWPRSSSGAPMVKLTMTASELVPTGDFANVTIGPAQIVAFVDPDNPEVFSSQQRENIAAAINEMAEIVEADCVAVQRNLVMESLQADVKSANS